MAQITSAYGLDIFVCVYEGTEGPCNTFIIVVVEFYFFMSETNRFIL